MLRKIRNTENRFAAVSLMQVGGVGLIFAQSGDNRLDLCVLIPCNKVGHKFFITSEKQVLRLQSSDFPRVLKGNGYLQTIHRLLPFSSTGPSSMSQAVLKQLSSNLLIKTGLLMPYNHLWSLLRPVHKEADLFDMDGHLPGKQPPPWRTQAQPKYQEKARKLFDEMRDRDNFSWTAMISGYVRYEKPLEALELYRSKQISEKSISNKFTVSSALAALSAIQCLRLGKEIHGCITRTVLDSDEGPEVRSGDLPGTTTNQFRKWPEIHTTDCVSVNYNGFVIDVEAGDMLLVDGGMMSFLVKSKTEDSVKCEVVDGGELKSRRHLNVRGKSATLPSITGCNADIHVIVKIESADSIPNLHSIITASDGEEIIRICRSMGKAVIVATNMLESMIVHPTPTRAEVSDIAIAVREGADAVMLSGETAHGKFPLKAVKIMHTVSLRTEATIPGGTMPPNLGQAFKSHMSEMFAYHATMMSNTLVTSIIVFTKTGFMAILLSHYRPSGTIFAFTNYKTIQQRLSLYQGVCPIYMQFSDDAEETFENALGLLQVTFLEPRNGKRRRRGSTSSERQTAHLVIQSIHNIQIAMLVFMLTLPVVGDASGERIGEVPKTDCLSKEVEKVVAVASNNVEDDDRLSSTTTVNGLNEERKSQNDIVMESSTIGAQGGSAPVKNQMLPFVKKSLIWKTIESMEVFQVVPQKPHFHPLSETKEQYREGSAIGIMVTFAGLFEKINMLKCDDSMDIFASTLDSLLDLEKHGFDVTLLWKRVNELPSIRKKQGLLMDDLKDDERGIIQHTDERTKLDEEMESIKKKMIENKIGKEKKTVEINKLRSRTVSINGRIRSTRLDFEKLAAAAWKSS
ncbi:hypothetical protein QYF36_002288 [Acer negundo]|nr:hypothetical protein QYF36_002288 [Acer negundo]